MDEIRRLRAYARKHGRETRFIRETVKLLFGVDRTYVSTSGVRVTHTVSFRDWKREGGR